MKKVNLVKPNQITQILPKLLHYQIGTKAYYEMLAIEFVKNFESF